MMSQRALTQQYQSTNQYAQLINNAVLVVKRADLGLEDERGRADEARRFLATLVAQLADLTSSSAPTDLMRLALLGAHESEDDPEVSSEQLGRLAEKLASATQLDKDDFADLDALTRAVEGASSQAFARVVRG
jgi:hypothetical protein